MLLQYVSGTKLDAYTHQHDTIQYQSTCYALINTIITKMTK